MTTNDTILVHTMGRVGSYTLQSSIESRLGRHIPHIHALNPKTLAQQVLKAGSIHQSAISVRSGLDAVLQVMQVSAPIKIVTATRDPVDRNLSAMFAAFRGSRDANEIDALLENANQVRTHWANAYHARPHQWFDHEIRDPLGLDVYEHPFPPDGVQTIVEGRVQLLLLRSELDNERKSAALANFLEVDHIPLITRNAESRQGCMADRYRRWRDIVGPSDSYLTEHRSTRYWQHFYAS